MISVMARIEPDQLQDPELIFLAATLRTARKVEALLDSHGVDYVVQVEELGRTTLFRTMRHAAGFYVPMIVTPEFLVSEATEQVS